MEDIRTLEDLDVFLNWQKLTIGRFMIEKKGVFDYRLIEDNSETPYTDLSALIVQLLMMLSQNA
jgi:hypothetical protein